MVDKHLRHGEILHVRRREGGADTESSCRYQAVGLVQGHPSSCEITPPGAGADALGRTEGGNAQAIDETAGNCTFARAQPAPYFLD